MKKPIVVATLAVSAICVTFTAPAKASDPFMAQIVMFGGNFAPRGWAFCDGQLLPIAQNSALFSLLGTTYGGDGETTFALPDLREAEKALRPNDAKTGPRYIIALKGIFPSRN